MVWKRVKAVELLRRRESVLQRIFNRWDAPKVRIAGAPRWLVALGKPEERKRYPAYGYQFEPDVLWKAKDRLCVAELKCSRKYEPLGLAEVLHHTYMLGRTRNKRITPVLITSYSPWLRAAMELIGAASPDLKVLEVDVLSRGELLWFDAPRAPWRRVRTAPDVLPAGYQSWKWFFVDETASFYGFQTKHAAKLQAGQRPILVDVPYAMLAPIALDGAQSGEWLFWQGVPPKEGDGFSAAVWARSEYWWLKPHASAGEKAASASEPRPISI